MSYCTADEVRAMIKPDALNMIIGDEYIEDEAEREAKIVPIIEEAISDADGEIDGYLAKRYPVPFTAIPKVINKFSKDIAVYNLFSRAGIDENEKEKN
jgi:Mu-like prophage protein gp36